MEIRWAYIPVMILTIVHLAFGQPDFLLSGNTTAMLTYNFFHANLFHLLVNCFSFIALYKRCRLKQVVGEMVLAYVVSIVVFPLSTRPIIGISNVLYAVIGMRTPPLRSRWWRSRNTLVFLLVTIALAFFPSVSAVTHIASFIIGVGIAVARRYIKSIADDTRRADK